MLSKPSRSNLWEAPQSLLLNRLYLAQVFLVMAGAFSWNILGLVRLLTRHKYLRTLDWWSIILAAGVVVAISTLGWIWVILSPRKIETQIKNPQRVSLKVSLWSGGGVFLLGWVICFWIMQRLMNNEPWCLTGVLGAMLGDWLPIGMIITVLIVVISLLTTYCFMQFNPIDSEVGAPITEDITSADNE